MNDYQKILEIIQNENNIKIANSYKKEVSFDVINSFNLKIKKRNFFGKLTSGPDLLRC